MNARSPLRAICLMVVSMAAFALTDMFMKFATETIPATEVILITSAGGAIFFASLIRAGGQPLFTSSFFSRAIVLRNTAEVFGSFCMVTALALTPLSLVVAINQATPLIGTVCAALFLGEQVGPGRWLAIGAGFLGALLILRPENAALTAGVLLSVGAAFGMAARDTCTRLIPVEVTTAQASFWGLGALIPCSAAILVATGGWTFPDGIESFWLFGATVSLILAYYTVTAAVRHVSVSLVIPYRYLRILFSMTIAVAVFGERPGLLTLIGAAIIVGSGLFVLRGERRDVRRDKPSRLNLRS